MKRSFIFILPFFWAVLTQASTSNGIIMVTSPPNNSSVATPVLVQASASTPPTCSAGISSMGIYPTSGNLLFKTSATSINKSFVLNPGSYPNFVVQEWDKCGGVSRVSLKITVTGSLPPPKAVTTWGYGNSRNNVNTQEYKLTPTNVKTATFGK